MTLQLDIRASENVREFYFNHTSAYEGDAGIDLFFPEDLLVKAGSTTLIDLQIACELREINHTFVIIGQNFFKNLSYYVYPRSSISKTPLRMSNSVGIIDSGYRHNIKVCVDNFSDTDYQIKRGDRLFQICDANLREIRVNLVDKLEVNNRGEGFGSSGN